MRASVYRAAEERLARGLWNLPLDDLRGLTDLDGDFLGPYHLQNWARRHGAELRAQRPSRPPAAARDWAVLGRLAWLAGDAGSAGACFARCERAGMTSAKAAAWRAVASAQSGRYDESIRALQSVPWQDWVWPRVWLAKVLLSAGDRPGAEAACTAVLRLQPRNVVARLLRALARLDPAAAARDLRVAVQVDRRTPGLWILLGRRLADSGDAAGAEAAFNSAADLRPDCMEGFCWLLSPDAPPQPSVRCLDRQLRQALDRRILREPRCWWAYALRGAYRSSGVANSMAQRQRRLADLRRAAALRPEAAWVKGQFARMVWTLEPEEGLRWIEEVVRMLPRSGWARAWRGQIRGRLGDLAGSRADLEAAVRLDPEYAQAFAWRGAFRRRSGRFSAAERDLDRALRMNPQYVPAYRERARLYADSGRVGEALQDLTRGLCLDPADPAAFSLVDPARGGAGLFQLDAFARRHPKEPLVYFWRGEALLRLGKRLEARRDLDRFLRVATASESPLARRLTRWARRWRAKTVSGRTRE